MFDRDDGWFMHEAKDEEDSEESQLQYSSKENVPKKAKINVVAPEETFVSDDEEYLTTRETITLDPE